MDPNITSAVRDIFFIIAAGAFAALCLAVIVIAVKLYRPLRDTAHNVAKATENLNRISSDFAAVSEETASNVAQTSRNAVAISENLKEGSKEISGTVLTAREAANKVAAAAGSVSTIAETVSRFSSLGVSGGGSSPGPGVGTLLRLLRTVLGGPKRGDDSGVQQGA